MRRRFSAVLVAALIATSAAAAPLDAERDCRVIDLRDARTSAPIIGAEDVVYDASADRFFVAAFDRDLAHPSGHAQGGLYILPRSALGEAIDASSQTPVIEISPLPLVSGDHAFVWPHGIDVSADGRSVIAIQRTAWLSAEERSRIVRFKADGDLWRMEVLAATPALCRANDLAITGGAELAITLDRGACGGLDMMVENVFALPRASVVRLEPDQPPRPIMTELLVANGVIAYGDGLVVAETREDRILWLEPGQAPNGPIPETPLGASPDNINRAPDGGLLVTAHDSLFQLALHRTFGDALGAPGGVVFHLSDADRGRDAPPEPLLRIPGEIFAGPTSAAAGSGVLLIGSATAAGVLACDWNAPKQDL